MPPIAHPGAVELWKVKNDAKKWRAELSEYKTRLRALGKPKLEKLDDAIDGLPEKINRDGRLSKTDYVTVVEWKLTRGKTRPGLLKYAQGQTEEGVRKATEEAFALARKAKNDGDLITAMDPLLALKGIGPATAAAYMSFADERYPFFSDEALVVVIGLGVNDKDRYSLPRYRDFLKALERRCEELNDDELTPSKLEKALWSAAAKTMPRKKG
jgi:hypothetical protein